MKFIKNIIFILIVSLCSFANAKSFSLQIIQKNGSENIVYETSYVIEQAILDYFFENMYIVSNNPIIIQKKGQDITNDLQKAFDAAQEGLLDYLIETEIFYNISDSTNPESANLQNIDKVEWRLISTDTKKTLSKGNLIPESKFKNNANGLIYFTNELAENIKKQIELKGGKK